MKYLSSLFIIFVLGCSAIAASPETQNPQNTVVPGNAPSYMTPGRVSVVPQDKLPTAMQNVVQARVTQSVAGDIYEPVPEDVFTYGLNYQSRILRDGNSMHNIKVKLAKIDGSALSSCRYEGFLPDGPTLNGPWTSVVRVFTCGPHQNHIVMLQEWDYVADGGGITLVKEAMNTVVGKYPAQMSKKRSPSGKIMTELSWATDKKYFTLTVWSDVPRISTKEKNNESIDTKGKITQQTMLDIANKLI